MLLRVQSSLQHFTSQIPRCRLMEPLNCLQGYGKAALLCYYSITEAEYFLKKGVLCSSWCWRLLDPHEDSWGEHHCGTGGDYMVRLESRQGFNGCSFSCGTSPFDNSQSLLWAVLSAAQSHCTSHSCLESSPQHMSPSHSQIPNSLIFKFKLRGLRNSIQTITTVDIVLHYPRERTRAFCVYLEEGD